MAFKIWLDLPHSAIHVLIFLWPEHGWFGTLNGVFSLRGQGHGKESI